MSQRLTVTLDDETYSYLKEQAERDYRTIGAEICYLLHLHVPAPITHTEPFVKPVLPENPDARPTLTSDTTAYYKRRKELI